MPAGGARSLDRDERAGREINRKDVPAIITYTDIRRNLEADWSSAFLISWISSASLSDRPDRVTLFKSLNMVVVAPTDRLIS